MGDVIVGGVPADEAIDHLKQKLRIPTKRWDDMLGEVHAKAFTVAGATKMDLLADLHQAVTGALESGSTLTDFRKDFDKIVQQHGWSYKGKRGWRTAVIYDNNLRTAHMAGRWKQLQRTKGTRPFLMYMTVGDGRVREQHRRWHKVVLPIDSPWWDSHFPPNGWNCRCYPRSLNKRQLEREGLEVSQAPKIVKTRRINSSTGEDFGEVPSGIDTGWDYNVGKAWLGSDIAFGEKLMKLPTAIRKEVLDNNSGHIDALSKSWQSWLRDRDGLSPKGHAHTVGYLPDSFINYLEKKGVPPIGAAIIVYDNKTKHLVGSHKQESKRFPDKSLQNLPQELRNYRAILKHKDEYIFVLNVGQDARKGRAVISVDFSRKGQRFNTIRSLGIIGLSHLRRSDYELIEGKL